MTSNRSKTLFILIPSLLILSVIYTAIDISPVSTSAYDFDYAAGILFHNSMKILGCILIVALVFGKIKGIRG